MSSTNTEPTAFEKWQNDAHNQFDNLAEKLLDELDQVMAKLVESKASFAEKLTLLACYVGHGKPGRAFLFLERGEFHSWLTGESAPRVEMQSAVIQLCLADIGSAVHEGDSFTRVLSLLPFVQRTKSVQIQGIATDSKKLWFDPWIIVSRAYGEDNVGLDVELSVRSNNCLVNDNIKYLGELVQKTEGEMLRTPNFGRKSLKEVKELLLAPHGARFGMKHPDLDKFNEELKAKQRAGRQ